MVNESMIALLERRRNRAIAIVLGVKEREIDPFLEKPLRDKLRKVVLDQFNDYHETALDIFRSTIPGQGEVMFNQIHLDMLEEIHGSMKELAERDS